ncbi:MAG: hypothetical protein IJZ06_04135 [Bacteroidales bacterium]|nr:hypothetical protein [Bacteroidales bacterium]
MLNFFKHNYLAQQIVVVVMAMVLWLPTFIMKPELSTGENNIPLYNMLISLFSFSPIIVKIIAFAVNVVSIFLFNSMLSANRLMNKTSSVGALAFLAMVCSCSELHLSLPFIFACPFILMAMHTMFLIYQTDTPENYMMNIGYFIALASMFYYPSMYLILWVLISFLIMGFNEIRYMLIPVTGFLIINAIVIGITFIFGDVNLLLDSYSTFFKDISFSFDLSGGNKIFLLISSLLFIVSIMKIFGGRNSDNASNVRKREGVAIVLTLFSIFIFFTHKPLMSNTILFMMYAFFYSIALSDVRKTRLANIIMVLMLLYVLANRYLPLFGIMI